MAIVLTEQPTANGLYSGYLPIKFIATEAANPAYLTFTLLTSAGASIANVPSYRALNVNNTFTFDASNYLKSIFKVASTTQGVSTTAIEELTDLYGKFEIVVSDTINSVTSLTSNEFYGFANIDGLRYLNDQTANDGINRKGMLYSSELVLDNLAPKFQGEFDRAIVFAQQPRILIDTYAVNKPNNGSTVQQSADIDISSYTNKLISVPLNRTFLQANALVVAGAFLIPLSSYKGFMASHVGTLTPLLVGRMYYYYEDRCNITEFIFINRYGAKENIKFQTYDYTSISTKSDSYRAGGYNHIGLTNTFNTSANNVKINQDNTESFEVRGQMFPSKHLGELQDFASSPLQGVVKDGEIVSINVLDGRSKLIIKSRGVEFNFQYQLAQKKPSFI
jgi:hypothetical protein